MKGLGAFALLVIFAAFVWVLVPLAREFPEAMRIETWTDVPRDLGRAGGLAPLIKTTVVVLTLSTIMVFVIGFPIAVQMSKSRSAWLRASFDMLAGTPSIVYGLIGHALFVQAMNLGYSAISGVLTLSFMVLPYFSRLVEDAIRQVPLEFELQSRALQLSEATYVLKVLSPLISSSTRLALSLSWMKAAAETAALLFTAGYSMRPTHGLGLLESGRVLPVHIFELTMNLSNGDTMAYRAAVVLLCISFGFSLVLWIPSLKMSKGHCFEDK